MGSVPVGRKKRADATGGKQTFRSPTAVVIWWVWLLFALANLIDLAVQGRDHFSLVAAAILVLVTGFAYVAAQRPRVIADDAGVTIVNPLRDHHIGWAGVTKVDLADLLRVHYQAQGRDKIVYAWAVHYSRRRKLVAEARAGRAAARTSSGRGRSLGGFGMGNYGSGRDLGYSSAPANNTTSSAELEAERIVQLLNEHVTAVRAETIWADGTAEIPGAPDSASEIAGEIEPARDDAADLRTASGHEPLISTWNRTALLALLIPVLILLVAIFT